MWCHWGAGALGMWQAVRESRPLLSGAAHAAHMLQVIESIHRTARGGTAVALTTGFPAPAPQPWARARNGVRLGWRFLRGPDNPRPAQHFTILGHDVKPTTPGPRHALDYLGMSCHGGCHTHVDVLCRVSHKGPVTNGHRARDIADSRGTWRLDIPRVYVDGQAFPLTSTIERGLMFTEFERTG
jgi:hypothetical protein